jgi:type IV secretory pathway VirB3-like protein
VYNLIYFAILLIWLYIVVIWFYIVVEANYERDMMMLDQKAMDFERMVRVTNEINF